MKKNILSLLFLLLCSVMTMAQNFSPEQMATRMSQEMKDYLNLTDEQYQALYALNIERSQYFMKQRQNAPDPSVKKTKEEIKAEKEKRKLDMEAFDVKLKEILTEKQYFAWEMERQRRMESGQFQRRD